MSEHRSYQGGPHPCCKCEACQQWAPTFFELHERIEQLERILDHYQAGPLRLTPGPPGP